MPALLVIAQPQTPSATHNKGGLQFGNTNQGGSFGAWRHAPRQPHICGHTPRRRKSYQPGYNHKPGEMNLFPIWEEIPAPVPSLPEAVQTNFDKYQNYIDKVEMMKKQLGLTKEAEALTRNHKGQQEQYDLIVNNLSK
ncbi:hypothetical protein [Terrimonas pollutisoli]|uniref:hypothetical protein n=1 Tax=Terrimonas pollutisoli TaxID=3034147 RepID=UPI0023ECE8E1|nr:hypothetical protein [Terrimonas sp. H1YJ31]